MPTKNVFIELEKILFQNYSKLIRPAIHSQFQIMGLYLRYGTKTYLNSFIRD